MNDIYYHHFYDILNSRNENIGKEGKEKEKSPPKYEDKKKGKEKKERHEKDKGKAEVKEETEASN